MAERFAADAVLILHALFVLFAGLGALLVLRWRRVAWLHVPAACWAAWIELSGGICPLTHLENALRTKAGQVGYPGGFVEHYLVPILYPAGLTRETQWMLAALIVGTNVLLYAWLFRRRPMSRGELK